MQIILPAVFLNRNKMCRIGYREGLSVISPIEIWPQTEEWYGEKMLQSVLCSDERCFAVFLFEHDGFCASAIRLGALSGN